MYECTLVLPDAMIEFEELSDWTEILESALIALIRAPTFQPLVADFLDSLHVSPVARSERSLAAEIASWWTPGDVYFAWAIQEEFARYETSDENIRAWARSRGVPIGTRGVVPTRVRTLYLAEWHR